MYLICSLLPSYASPPAKKCPFIHFGKKIKDFRIISTIITRSQTLLIATLEYFIDKCKERFKKAKSIVSILGMIDCKNDLKVLNFLFTV